MLHNKNMQVFAFVTAFCAMGLQLTIAQTVTSLLGGAILRYSIVIGLFIASLGFGAALVAWRDPPKPAASLLLIEIALAFVVPLLPLILFGAEPYGLAFEMACLFSGGAGFLAGMELPLLNTVAEGFQTPLPGDETPLGAVHAQSQKLVGLDFLGTFLAAVIIPIAAFPGLNLIGTAALCGMLSALASWGPLCWLGVAAQDTRTPSLRVSSRAKHYLMHMVILFLMTYDLVILLNYVSIARWLSTKAFASE
jgi:spermidine synthase